jgi:hypothetical protein
MNFDLVLDILHQLLCHGDNPPRGITNVPVGTTDDAGICFVPAAWRIPGNYPPVNSRNAGQCFVWCQVQPHQAAPHLRVKLVNVGHVTPTALREQFNKEFARVKKGDGPWPTYYQVPLGVKRDDYTVEKAYAEALFGAIVDRLSEPEFAAFSRVAVGILS